jgi:hypothetical protein
MDGHKQPYRRIFDERPHRDKGARVDPSDGHAADLYVPRRRTAARQITEGYFAAEIAVAAGNRM